MIVPTDVFLLVIWMCGSADVTANVTIRSEIFDIVSQRNVGVDTAPGTECKVVLSILHVPVRMMMYCLQKHLLIG
jgi:MinD superfamily P-loop ATPase